MDDENEREVSSHIWPLPAWLFFRLPGGWRRPAIAIAFVGYITGAAAVAMAIAWTVRLADGTTAIGFTVFIFLATICAQILA
jgi:hypothetical protein